MKIGQIHHLEFYVKNLAETKKFWDWLMSALQYSVKEEWNQGISYIHPNGTYIVFVQLDEKEKIIENDRQGQGLNHLAFSVYTSIELDRLQEALEFQNIKILKRKDDYLCFEECNQFAVEIFANKVIKRTLQKFSDEALENSKKMTPEEVIEALQEFRELHLEPPEEY